MTRPTIYSIARECGVSASTVSRALSRPEMVGAAARTRILATARRLGYHANKAARGLATGRTGTIGLLVPDIMNPFFPPLVRAVTQAAAASDMSVVLVDAGESAAGEARLVDRIRHQVDGVVIASPRSVALRRVLGDLPAVVVNRRVRGLPSVVGDTTRALREAGDLLRQLGHRRVALVRGPKASWVARRRADAVAAWAEESRVRLVDLGSFPASFEGGTAAGRGFLRTTCTAAFAFDDLVACGMLAELTEAGVHVPDDRSLVGCDDVLLARTVTPRLTTVAAPVDQLGQAAVEMLRGLLDGAVVRDREVDGQLVVRASTGPVPGPASGRGARARSATRPGR